MAPQEAASEFCENTPDKAGSAGRASSIPQLWKAPSARQSATAHGYMSSRRADDGAEGLWRVHDGLYDLSDFAKHHPGGEHWLRTTRGTDITEAFESHHLTSRPADLLRKLFVRSATQRRNSPFTFCDNGFYRTLKRRALPVLARTPAGWLSRAFNDGLVTAAFVALISAAALRSYAVATVGALIIAVVANCAHNFTHMRDNWRMYYLSLSFMSLREWRVSHILSHHLFPNTLLDMEVVMHEPMLQFLPSSDKPLLLRVGPYAVFTAYTALAFPLDLPNRLKRFRPEDALPILFLVAMVFVGGAPISEALPMFLYVWLAVGVLFYFSALTAAHHHPDIFHDGDVPREDRDFGLGQLDATRDRWNQGSNPFLVLGRFGDHALHHLFPTVDHCRLRALYPVFQDTLKEFGVEYRYTTTWELFVGAFRQIKKTENNAKAPGAVIALGQGKED